MTWSGCSQRPGSTRRKSAGAWTRELKRSAEIVETYRGCGRIFEKSYFKLQVSPS
jgi:hypothetical protein